MLRVEKLDKTDSHLLSILGLRVGFSSTEWFEGSLILTHHDQPVASLEGELLEQFQESPYVKSNYLAD